MDIYAFEPVGFYGELVRVEVDMRRGIPNVDIVGLPDGAVKEARERIKAAIRNSGFDFPMDRILINLAPAGVKKGGAAFDLAMALAVLAASGQIPCVEVPVLALGELELSGALRPVSGVMAAISAGAKAAIPVCAVPEGNAREARIVSGGPVFGLRHLSEAAGVYAALREEPDTWYCAAERMTHVSSDLLCPDGAPDTDACMSDIRGQARLKRSMEIAAAGAHHSLLFGPPGSGKTMAARRLPGLLPELDTDDAVTLTTLHSLAGLLPEGSGLITTPPFRSPHHGASAEGIVGGGRSRKPGEISLAHGGVLLLDEAAEFRCDVLQALREPLEEGRISIVRADARLTYPSRFMLVLACNPCPCGNLGRKTAVCLCSSDEIRRYWKRLGGPLLDRIDIRVPVQAASPEDLAAPRGETSAVIRGRVGEARLRQARRYTELGFKTNGFLGPATIDRFCRLDSASQSLFIERAKRDGLSSRASHSVLRLARTISDLAAREHIGPDELEEAFALRKYGDGDIFWIIP